MREPENTAEKGLLNDALTYLAHGWSIIPLKPGTKEAKHRWKRYQTNRAAEGTVRNWYGKGKDAGIAVVLGDVSGNLVCRDFDDLQSYEAWAARFPQLAETLPTVQTPRGRHVYCTVDPAEIQAAGAFGVRTTKFDDGEFRASGCYCALPPSIHPSGEAYRWLIPLQTTLPRFTVSETGFLESYSAVSSNHATERDREDRRRQREPRNTEHTDAMGGDGEAASQTFFSSDWSNDTLSQDVERAILGSQPKGPGHRYRQVFELCRALKGIPLLADAPGQQLERIVRQWHKRALPHIRTEPFEETLIDFLKGWSNVKYPKGAEPMAEFMGAALKLPSPPEADRYGPEEIRQLVTLCRELQRAAGDGAFFLSVRTAGALLSVDKSTVSRWLFLLEQHGLLQVVEKGSQKTKKATRFHYCGQL